AYSDRRLDFAARKDPYRRFLFVHYAGTPLVRLGVGMGLPFRLRAPLDRTGRRCVSECGVALPLGGARVPPDTQILRKRYSCIRLHDACGLRLDDPLASAAALDHLGIRIIVLTSHPVGRTGQSQDALVCASVDARLDESSWWILYRYHAAAGKRFRRRVTGHLWKC